MAKIKRISVNAFERAMKETNQVVETFDWNGIEVTVKRNLSLKEMLEFVDTVVKSCFAKDTNAFMPEIRDFATKACILEKYANFTMPRNIEAQYTLIYGTDVVACVCERINSQQLNEICSAITDKLKHLAQANIESIERQMNNLYSTVKDLVEKFAHIFEGVSESDIKNLTKLLAGESVDEEKIVQAVLNKKSNDGE